MMCQWNQELLGYHHTCLYRPTQMMVDMDGLTRRFGNIATNHLYMDALPHRLDVVKRPEAHGCAISEVPEPTKLIPTKAMEYMFLF